MKKNLRNGVRFLKIFLGDTNHDEAPSNSDSIRKNLDGNDAEKYTLLKRWTECNTHCYWLLAAIYQSTLQGWRYTLISFPLVWPVARVPRFVLLSYCNCFKVVCDLQLNRPIKNTEWSLWVKLILNGHTVLREAAGKRRFEIIKISRTFGIIWNNIVVLIIFKIKRSCSWEVRIELVWRATSARTLLDWCVKYENTSSSAGAFVTRTIFAWGTSSVLVESQFGSLFPFGFKS